MRQIKICYVRMIILNVGFPYICTPKGELAQLVERLHGMQEVTGSNPVFSTIKNWPLSYKRLSGFFY